MDEWDNFRWLVNVFTYLHSNQDKAGVRLSKETLVTWDGVMTDLYAPFVAPACKRFGVTPGPLQTRWILMMAGTFDNSSAKARVESACAFFAGIFGNSTPPTVGFLPANSPFADAGRAGLKAAALGVDALDEVPKVALPDSVSVYDGSAFALDLEGTRLLGLARAEDLGARNRLDVPEEADAAPVRKRKKGD